MNDYGNIFDTSSMRRLQHDLQNPTRENVREVAKQFESLFVQTMLKSMRAATPGDPLFGGAGEEQYRDLFDQQLSLNVSRGQGLGLAPLIERQLLANMGIEEETGPELNKGVQRYFDSPVASRVAAQPVGDVEPAANAVEAANAVGAKAPAFNQPEDFVRAVWDAAESTARRLGVSARALVAQAALETGWGQHVISRGDGNSSFNLFGIKAHRDWDGDTVKVPTLEYRDGVPRREMWAFRAYQSVEESFDDYVNFLHSNPRYQRALEVADDPEAYVQALQEAGYATDPKYAEKITRIMNGRIIADASPQGGR